MEEEKEEFEGNTESTASKNMSSNSAAKEASKTWNGRKEVVNIMFMFFDVVRCVCLLCVCVYCIVYLIMKKFSNVFVCVHVTPFSSTFCISKKCSDFTFFSLTHPPALEISLSFKFSL